MHTHIYKIKLSHKLLDINILYQVFHAISWLKELLGNVHLFSK